MREILFRAKRTDNGEWVEGFYQNRFDVNEEIEHLIFWRKSCTVWEYAKIDPETLCQYTGLKDKNGNRIWENDIVDASEEWWSACGPAGHNSPIIKVEWLEGLTGFDPFANYDCDCGVYIDASGCEVIGNIFDNPELLKGE